MNKTDSEYKPLDDEMLAKIVEAMGSETLYKFSGMTIVRS